MPLLRLLFKSIYTRIICIGIFLLFTNCDHKIQTSRKKAAFLPNHAAIILQCHNMEQAKANLENLELITENPENEALTYFENQPVLQQLAEKNKNVTICFSPTAKNKYESTIITTDSIFASYNNKIPQEKTLGNQAEKHKGFLIQEILLKEIPFWITKFETSYIISSNKNILKTNIDQFIEDIPFKNQPLINSWDKNATASYYVNLDRLIQPIAFVKGFKNKFEATGYLAGDINIEADAIVSNAVFYSTTLKDLPYFKTQGSVDFFKHFLAIDESFHLEEFSSASSTENNEAAILTQSQAVGILKKNSHTCLGVKLLPDFNAQELFESYAETDSTAIKKLKTPVFTSNFDIPFAIGTDTLDFGMVKNGFLILGKKTPISELLKTTVTSEKKLTYQALRNYLNQNAAYKNIQPTAAFFKDLNIAPKLNTEKYPLTGISIQQNRDYAYIQVAIPKKVNVQKTALPVTKTFEKPIYDPVILGPFFFKNYLTKENDILIQTENYKLQLYAHNGKLLWSKALNEPILGKIHEIDIYKNGRIQMTFVTPSKWYVLDRNGNDVTKFPENFKDEITQPLSLFDYDNNKEYRFGITQEQNFTVFNKKAKKVGFNFKNEKSGTIKNSPKHLRIANKDFILINEEKGGTHFLSRTGKERIKLSKPLHTDHEWYMYKNTFSTLDKDHLLLQVNTNGKLGRVKKHPADEFTKVDASSKTWVSFTGNELFIKNKKATLEFGSYTAPQLFYLGNKIYVSITNQETDKTYLFDSNANLIKGFPIQGSKITDMRMNKLNKNIDIITVTNKNSLVLNKLKR